MKFPIEYLDFEETERMLHTMAYQNELAWKLGFNFVCWIANCWDFWKECPQ